MFGREINLHGLLLGAIRTGGRAGPSTSLRSLVDWGGLWAGWWCKLGLRIVLGFEQPHTIQCWVCGTRVTTTAGGDDVGCDGRHNRVLQPQKKREKKGKKYKE